ncbi:Putative ATP-dependent RNA helicase DHX57 [Durusdinium trenchii]|uniref:ATP-dependent RNA helicase DHX57 n=1 Tax=Durusdinium trenchii TaxID=1381693 RepID=A0ABP0JM59_9DINO
MRGWPTWPTSVLTFRQMLSGLPDRTTMVFRRADEWQHDTVDLFTDGTIDIPACQATRIASWALVASGHRTHQTLEPVAWGWVPGPRQTVVRAEIWALISALRFVQNGTHRFRIWTDNEEAATARREYQLLQSGTSSVYAHFVRVGLMALQCKKPLQQSHDKQIRCQHEHIAIDTHAFSHWLKWSSPDKLRFRGFDKFISFWTNLSDSAEPPLLYAWHELFIAWQLKTGSIGISRLKSG